MKKDPASYEAKPETFRDLKKEQEVQSELKNPKKHEWISAVI
jgi:hypothetical protein